MKEVGEEIICPEKAGAVHLWGQPFSAFYMDVGGRFPVPQQRRKKVDVELVRRCKIKWMLFIMEMML
jgi:hypothetical protein